MKSPKNLLARRRHPAVRSSSQAARTQETPTSLLEPSSLADIAAARWPSLDISEDDKEVRVKVEVPGLSEKDVRISWSEGSLRIEGEKKEDKEGEKGGVRYRETRYGSFSRSVPIESGVDPDKARAEFKQGILKVVLPKTPAGSGKKSIRIE